MNIIIHIERTFGEEKTNKQTQVECFLLYGVEAYMHHCLPRCNSLLLDIPSKNQWSRDY